MSKDVIKDYYDRHYAGEQLTLDDQGNTLHKIEAHYEELHPNMKILDLGCGTGSVSFSLIEQGHEVHGLEITDNGVAVALERGIHAQVHDLNESLPYDDNQFDIVLALDVIHLTYAPLQTLKEMLRVLKGDGYIIATFPVHFDILQRMNILFGKGIILHEHRVYDPDHEPWNYFRIRFFTRKDSLKLLSLAGLNIKKATYRPLQAISFPVLRRIWSTRLASTLASFVPSLFCTVQMFTLLPQNNPKDHEIA